MKRIFRILLLTVLVLMQVSCSYQPNVQTADIRDYRDIPGITEEEIRAIEELKARGTTFVYGMQYSTEAFLTEEGIYGGFSARFCEWLTGLFGIPFQVALYDLDALVDGLESGDIHFTSELSPSEDRGARYQVSGSISHRITKLFRMRDASDGDGITRQKPRYVLLNNSPTYDLLMGSEAEDFLPIFVDTPQIGVELLKSGDADGLLIDNTSEANLLGEARIESEDFYPIIYKPKALMTADSSLAPIIRVVDKFMEWDRANTLLQLYDEGHEEFRRYAFTHLLTDKEKAHRNDLIQNGGIRVMYEYDNYPVSFYNEAEGEYQGIAVDVLNAFSGLAGIPLEVAEGEVAFSGVLASLVRGDVDIMSELLYSVEREQTFVWPEFSNMEDKLVLIGRSGTQYSTIGDVMNARVGLINSTAFTEQFLSWFPSHEYITMYPYNEAAFDALEDGEIDLVMSTQKKLLSYSNYKERPVFQAGMVFDSLYESKFGLLKENQVLADMISKSYWLLDIESISNNWNYKVFDYQKRMYEMRTPYLIAVCVLLFVVLSLVSVFGVRIKNNNRILERTVQERTKDLENQKTQLENQTRELEEKSQELEVQTEAARAASKSKGEFLARMSHEIRTPLNAIIGMTDIGMASDKVEKKQSCFRQVEAASNQLLGIINDILDMSKIEANKLEIELREMDLEQTLINVANVINFRVEEKKQTFLVNTDKNMPVRVIADELRLTQVVTNLLSNAVKFTPEGGVIRLNVLAEHQKAYWYKLRFEVCDNGIGITEADQKKLFRSFEQADGSVARRFGGTGLGLAISKNLVELMGGEIWVESRAGEGSKFVFTLDCERARQSPKPTLHPQVNRDALRVLVADDSPEIRSYFASLMEASGIPCDTAADGFEALELFADAYTSHPYNVIFVDWMMPKMDGIELSKRLKAISDDNAVIMISAANREDVENIAREAGISTILPKPIFPSMLINAVNESLGLSTIAQQPEQPPLSFDFRGKTVLLAEDIPINREIVKTYLEDTGIAIDEAENGVVAVHKFQGASDRYDAILMDIHMPDMDGYEATLKIRGTDTGNAATVPILAMTANVFREDIDKCLAVGMNNHIGKPVKMADLREKLAAYLHPSIEAAPGESGMETSGGAWETIPHIDWQEAMEMTGGNEGLYLKLLGSFQGQVLFDHLHSRLEQNDGDFEATRKSAHALKGAAAGLALSRLYRLASEIEELSKENMSAAHLREDMETTYRQTMREREMLLHQKRSAE